MTYQIYIYKIFWDDCDDFYIGSTKMKLCKRMTQHRTDCRKGSQLKLYNFMREKAENKFQYVLISTHNVCSKDEQRQAEQRVIDELKPTLNMYRAFCSKEYIEEYHREYNKKRIPQSKEYREQNKERILQRNKEYREQNKERILQRNKEYNEKHGSKKMQCHCGSVVRKSDICRHLRSKKHQFYESIYNFIHS